MNSRFGKLGSAGVVISLLLASCATLEKDECAVANWYELGRADGEKGRNVTRASSYREDCAKFGIPIDDNNYRAGWDLGIRQYCTPENGFDRGINGRFANNSCPAELAAQFEQPYALGREIYDLDKNVEVAQLKIDDLNDALDADKIPRDVRRQLRRERRLLREERREYLDSLDFAVLEARRLGFDVNY